MPCAGTGQQANRQQRRACTAARTFARHSDALACSSVFALVRLFTKQRMKSCENRTGTSSGCKAGSSIAKSLKPRNLRKSVRAGCQPCGEGTRRPARRRALALVGRLEQALAGGVPEGLDSSVCGVCRRASVADL